MGSLRMKLTPCAEAGVLQPWGVEAPTTNGVFEGIS
jgi:hypothetical protein